jgi:SAM-dependent methyltransferase
MKNYTLKGRVYTDANRQDPFDYSDGDDTENYILQTITHATDLSICSGELILAIKDWPTLYHLHPNRSNLLRPLASLLKGRQILEIGCGCGAITRYLGELDAKVLALEGSYRRASIAAERCRDLPNVEVLSTNFLHFEPDQQFDVITLIGVLEYAGIYFPGQDPFRSMLERARRLLRPDGLLVIAIENKLGLKYWAGAPEDHTGQAYLGIGNGYGPGQARTFGRSELKELLSLSGFPSHPFLYPFPDYKLPTTLITEAGIGQPGFDVHMLLLEKFEYVQSDYYSSQFSTSLAGREIEKNGLLADLSNSFLVLAGQQPRSNLLPEDLLAVNYNSQRKKEYQKATSFLSDKDHGIRISKEKMYDHPPDPAMEIVNTLRDEPYFGGELLLWVALKLISRNGWTIGELLPWAGNYYEILRSFASYGGDRIDGKYIDLTPFNIIIDDQGKTRIFDQEWSAPEPLPLGYVFFRGLFYSLGSISFFNPPAEGTPLDILELTIAIYKNFRSPDPEELERFRAIELGYFSGVALQEYKPFMNAPLRIRKVALMEQRVETLQQELVSSQQRFQADIEWYMRTYQQKSLLGLVRQKITERFHKQKLK